MTPKQILDKYTTVIETEFGYTENQIIQMMKEYATLCCEAQRIACTDNTETCLDSAYNVMVDRDSILNTPITLL
jgi:hypothetical protein